MNTLEQLQTGQLQGAKRLDLAAQLTEFPPEIFELKDSLEILNLTNNRLNHLPDEFACLQKLKILFLSNNEFEVLPSVLAQCPQLSMVGFKANRIRTVDENSLPALVRWLILTDNQIEQLPTSMGQLSKLQKLMLAGNQLRSLPPEMVACQNLELIRLAANRLEVLPEWLLSLPRLAWLAYSGNPFCGERTVRSLPTIDWSVLSVGELLGEGASGVIYRGVWQSSQAAKTDVAIKLFKGAVTSDGLPADEMAAYITAGNHPNLVKLLGQLHNHPAQKSGLVFAFIPPHYRNLGNPPDFDTCTRDTYPADATFSPAMILNIARGVAAAAAHLHSQGIMHGDLYAHNILINAESHSLLGDFGAASMISPTMAQSLEQIEVRAFGCLLEDLLDRCSPAEDASLFTQLVQLQNACLGSKPDTRPLFTEIVEQLA